MKGDLNDLKKLTMELMKSGNIQDVQKENEGLIQKIYGEEEQYPDKPVETNVEVLTIPQQAL